MHTLTSLVQEALLLVLIASALPVLAGLVVGFLVSLVQATTQLQEQTLSFAPKVVAIFGTLALAGPWIGSQLVRFAFHVFDRFAGMVGP